MSRYLPLLLTIIGCGLITILVDKQHHLAVSLTHLQKALSDVHVSIQVFYMQKDRKKSFLVHIWSHGDENRKSARKSDFPFEF